MNCPKDIFGTEILPGDRVVYAVSEGRNKRALLKVFEVESITANGKIRVYSTDYYGEPRLMVLGYTNEKALVQE